MKEYSLTFHVPTLGMSLLPTERQGEMGQSPCVVGMIQKPEVCTGVLPGDSLSRINGVPVSTYTFNCKTFGGYYFVVIRFLFYFILCLCKYFLS